MKLFLKILNGVISAALVLAIALSAVVAIAARRSRDAVPDILGHKVLTVLSGSMEPTIHTGDVIIVKPLKNPAEEVKDGDIITFRTSEQANMLITHRVQGTVMVNKKPSAFATKGDANQSPDLAVVLPGQIVGRYQWRVPYFGYVSTFIRTPVGIALLVILPGVILIGLEFRKMWKALSEAEAAKAKANQGEGGDQESR
ncbi:MAG TPA: signal peptidase I [Symbiobacteriaceae bacterium]